MTLSETDSTPAPETKADTHHEAPISAAGLKILYAVIALAVVAWGLAIFTFGVPGLYIPALALVPGLYVLMILAAKG